MMLVLVDQPPADATPLSYTLPCCWTFRFFPDLYMPIARDAAAEVPRPDLVLEGGS
jgi:hypothetical protein